MNNKAVHLVFLLLLVAFFSAVFNSCSKEQATVSLGFWPKSCDDSSEYIDNEISYQGDIVNIMNGSCAYSPCHVPGSGNYDFTRYEVLADRIRAGRLEERLLISTGNPLHMPQGFTLDECQLYKLRLWIHQGFQNN